ncbi:MAG: MqnA/MqnD/SBP family protein [Gemmatimonadales bacterium]|nr:ABC transporter substrate-binding protein [Gemmatimonadota bacterium]MDX2056757.1 MqnA/MqnD/SBP family protein [Gemmatimonadales bacterium]
MLIRVAHSPDSDDAFMFYALASGQIDTGSLEYVHELQDIETLNRRALKGELEVTAVSLHAYAYLADRYALLSSGCSMGDGYGPRLVATSPKPADPRAAIKGLRIAVPGTMTTAYLALRLYQPDFEPVVMPFDQIEDAVLRGEVPVGLLIHEGQLTYADLGLHLWDDMGAWWLRETGLPLPLGGNVVRRDLGPVVMAQVARDLKASIEFSLAHRKQALAHAKQYNRGISDERTDTFVGMYVNQWTVDYGDRGRRAVQLLLDRGHEAGIIPHRVAVEFIG